MEHAVVLLDEFLATWDRSSTLLKTGGVSSSLRDQVTKSLKMCQEQVLLDSDQPVPCLTTTTLVQRLTALPDDLSDLAASYLRHTDLNLVEVDTPTLSSTDLQVYPQAQSHVHLLSLLCVEFTSSGCGIYGVSSNSVSRWDLDLAAQTASYHCLDAAEDLDEVLAEDPDAVPDTVPDDDDHMDFADSLCETRLEIQWKHGIMTITKQEGEQWQHSVKLLYI